LQKKQSTWKKISMDFKRLIANCYKFLDLIFDSTNDLTNTAVEPSSLRSVAHLIVMPREIGHNLEIRVGIRSGGVTAGVIGKMKFIYDRWGATVNIASRMESHGIPGRVQVSSQTHDMLKQKYAFEHRGNIVIKGKGPLDFYLLRS